MNNIKKTLPTLSYFQFPFWKYYETEVSRNICIDLTVLSGSSHKITNTDSVPVSKSVLLNFCVCRTTVRSLLA